MGIGVRASGYAPTAIFAGFALANGPQIYGWRPDAGTGHMYRLRIGQEFHHAVVRGDRPFNNGRVDMVLHDPSFRLVQTPDGQEPAHFISDNPEGSRTIATFDVTREDYLALGGLHLLPEHDKMTSDRQAGLQQ